MILGAATGVPTAISGCRGAPDPRSPVAKFIRPANNPDEDVVEGGGAGRVALPEFDAATYFESEDFSLPIACFAVSSRARLLKTGRFWRYCLAISGTKGSFGFGSVNKLERDSTTLNSDRAGDQAAFRISMQIWP